MSYAAGQDGRGNLDYLRIVSDPSQIAVHYRSMLASVERDYAEFSRPPYAVDPLDEQLVKQCCARGVRCRLLVEQSAMDRAHQSQLEEYRLAGVEVRLSAELPMKLAVFDSEQGLVALLDPVTTRPAWTAVIFDHAGFAGAMRTLFDQCWDQANPELP